MSFNYNVFGAVTAGIGLLLAVIPMFLCFAIFSPTHLRKALDNALFLSDQALLRIQETGTPLDDFSGGLKAARERLDAFHQEGLDLSTQVDALVTLTSELKAVWHGLSLKVWRLKRKIQLFAAEVALAEASGRRRQGQTPSSTPTLQAMEARSSATETTASSMQAEAPDPVVRLDVLRQRPQNHHNDDHDRDDTLHHSGATTAHSIIHSQETRGGDNNMVVNESTRKKGSDSEKDVNIVIKSSPVRFIMFIDVVYGEKASDAPQGRVRTFNGNNDDINAKFGGKFVWMVPRWITDITKAATSFAIFIHTHSVPGRKDLAAGAGGDYRYVITNHDENNPRKVIAASLIRSSDSVSVQQQQNMLGKGWVGGQCDINRGRRGDWLYLAYKLS